MEQEKSKVAFVSVLAAIFLTIFKFIIGVITGSIGILSEALHSGLDLVAAIVTFFAIKFSNKVDKNSYQEKGDLYAGTGHVDVPEVFNGLIFDGIYSC